MRMAGDPVSEVAAVAEIKQDDAAVVETPIRQKIFGAGENIADFTVIVRKSASLILILLPSTAGCSAKGAPAAAQASSHFLADDRAEETAAELLAFLLTRSTEDFVARGAFGRRGSWRSCCSE
jgi:hypothetical protein